MFLWNSFPFLMIQRMLAIWSLVPLPFLKPAWTSGSSWFTYCWSWALRIFSTTLPVCEMGALVRQLERSLALPFLGLEWKLTFLVLWPLLSFPDSKISPIKCQLKALGVWVGLGSHAGRNNTYWAVLLRNLQCDFPYVFLSGLIRNLRQDSYSLLPEGLAGRTWEPSERRDLQFSASNMCTLIESL